MLSNVIRRALIAAPFICVLATGTSAYAGKGDIDFSDSASVLKGGEYWGFNAVPGVNKKTGLPAKVAIGMFQVQFTLRTQEFGDSQQVWITFGDDDYQTITDAMYELFVESLQAHGYEVVSKEALLASPTYELINGDLEPKANAKRAIFAATDMKRLSTVIGGVMGVKNLQTFPALNNDLGTDSVLAVVANISLCETRIKGQGRGTAVCTGPVAGTGLNQAAGQYPALNVTWYHGAKEGGTLPGGRVTWTSLGQSTMGKAGGAGPFVYTEEHVRAPIKRGLFSTTYGTDADVFADGALTLWDQVLFLTWAQWEDAMIKPRKKLGAAE